VPELGRLAHIYVFAHHPGVDPNKTDHRDPYQWDFYVLSTSRLTDPKQKQISLSSIRALGVQACKFDALADVVEKARADRVVSTIDKTM